MANRKSMGGLVSGLDEQIDPGDPPNRPHRKTKAPRPGETTARLRIVKHKGDMGATGPAPTHEGTLLSPSMAPMVPFAQGDLETRTAYEIERNVPRGGPSVRQK